MKLWKNRKKQKKTILYLETKNFNLKTISKSFY